MFYSSQSVEKSLPKPLPAAPLEKKNDGPNKALNSLLGLPMQRFYNTIEDHENRRISINMTADDAEPQDMASHYPKENTMNLLMHHSIQKAAWVEDPLRLCLVEAQASPTFSTAQPKPLDQESIEFQSVMPFGQEEMLPYTFKPKSRFLYKQLLSQLYVVMGHNQWISQTSPQQDEEEEENLDRDYLDLAFELPFSTAAFIPPTPPPKEITTTPSNSPPIILPVEAYSDIYDRDYQEAALPWLYTREEETYYDQSIMTSSPLASTSVFYFEDDEQQQQHSIAEESWEAIFHPLSTFKHNKGELEYYAWNSVNLPAAAALVAQRVTNPTSHSIKDTSMIATEAAMAVAEATIPQIMPTPPLKPSPILTIIPAEDENALERDGSEITLVNSQCHEAVASSVQEGYYYDMLQKIRGSNGSSLDESRSTLQSTDASIIDKEEIEHTHKDNHTHKSFRRQTLASALLLGGFSRNKPANSTASAMSLSPTTPSTAVALAHNEYAMEDEKPVDTADPEILLMEKPHYWTEKRLFWAGFMCPLLWYYGSIHLKASSTSRLMNPSDLRWQKRCRLAALYFSIVLSVVILVTSVKAAGSAAVRQTQTDTIRAVIAD
ncbi:hypothetical protein [Parasitella parasitica]|uniref:Uncharacterized protein n=1 Tax=Parasitella parasitica TaxID=35722 RepID=A0A0B7NFF1_9FUNG|nr:hypothetical protein [Parasitella parasitica]